jgi:hypothetical protein
MSRGGARRGSGPKRGFRHAAVTRVRLRTIRIVDRLVAFVLHEPDPSDRSKNPQPVKMSPSEVTAALGLLRKTLPDLAAIELAGEVDTAQHLIADRPLTEAEWFEQYGTKLIH